MEANKTRTVRFGKAELKRIEKFLGQNPFLDFSTLTRLAINLFIENPTIEIKAVTRPKKLVRSLREASA